MGLTTFGSTFEYQSAPGSRVVVASKQDMSIVADVRLPAFSTFHFANAYEVGGKLHVLVNRLVSYWKPFQEKSSRLVRVPSLSFVSALRSAVNLEVVKDLQPSERSSHFRENRHRPIIQEFEGALFKVPFTRPPRRYLR
jgi:carotenoid cleavage dioxygenase-like enzyme